MNYYPNTNMRAYRTEVTPAREHEVCSSIQCDLCGKTTARQWKDGAFDATETEVRWKTGSSYPEGGYGEETEIDICPECFETKLIPWVRSKGGEPTTKEWDW